MGTDFIYFVDVPWYPTLAPASSAHVNIISSQCTIQDIAARVLVELLGATLPKRPLPSSPAGQPILSEDALWALLLPRTDELRRCSADELRRVSEAFLSSLRTALSAIDRRLLQYAGDAFDRRVLLAIGILFYGLAHWANAVLHDEKRAILLLDGSRLSQDLITAYREELSERWDSDIGYELDRVIDGGLPFIAYASNSTPTHNRSLLLDPNDYVPLHRSPRCSCSFIRPPIYDVIGHLANGRIPVMIFNGNVLSVRDSCDVDYVAISHVWADGLGSTAEVGLPACQISHIASLARRLVPGGAFWLDALCIPEEDASRRRAIALMAQTYEHAAKVLVTDGGVRTQCSLASPKEECILRIATSGWMQRIWTLQEGMLARELCFEVSDGFIDVTHFNGPSFHLAWACIPLLRRRPHGLESLEYHAVSNDPPRCSYRDVIALLRHRTTSKSRDESVAIAGLLGVDAAELVAIPDGDARMRTLLMRCRTLPRCVAVYGWFSRRLDIPGFRWAPSSITNVLWQGDEEESFATCTEDGLHGRYTIIRFPTVDMHRLSGIVVTIKGEVLLQTQRRGEEVRVVSSRTVHIQLSAVPVIARIQSGRSVALNGILITDRALPTQVSEQAAAGIFIPSLEGKPMDDAVGVSDADPLQCEFIAAGKVEANDHVAESRNEGGAMKNWKQLEGVMYSMIPVRLA